MSVLFRHDCFVVRFIGEGYYSFPDLDRDSFMTGGIEQAIQYSAMDSANAVMDSLKGLRCDCKVVPVRVTITERDIDENQVVGICGICKRKIYQHEFALGASPGLCNSEKCRKELEGDMEKLFPYPKEG